MEQHETEAALLPNIANQMRSLLSNLYLAASQVIPPEQREQDPALDAKAAILEQSFFRLLRLVNSMSAAEYLSDSQTLSLRDADLVKLVSEVCESSADLAEQLGIQLKFVCAMDRRVCAIHPAAVEQMLYHLLSNALKFTPAGGTVTVELKKSGETLRLTVSDTGCGIPPERMAHLFDGCFQPGHPSPAPYGLGLGLPLCRAIAEKHGGSITVESAPALWSLCRTGSWAASFPTSPPSTMAASAVRCWDWRMRFPLMRLPCGIWNNRRTKILPFYRNPRKAAQSRFSVPKNSFRPADLIFRTL